MAKANTPAAGVNPAAAADEGKTPGPAQDAQISKPVKGFFIRSRPATGFRRCGFAFTPEGFGIAESALTDEQIEILLKEPNLVVQYGEFGGNAEHA